MGGLSSLQFARYTSVIGVYAYDVQFTPSFHEPVFSFQGQIERVVGCLLGQYRFASQKNHGIGLR
jgi:hypothetical protein